MSPNILSTKLSPTELPGSFYKTDINPLALVYAGTLNGFHDILGFPEESTVERSEDSARYSISYLPRDRSITVRRSYDDELRWYLAAGEKLCFGRCDYQRCWGRHYTRCSLSN
jgi:hypothetical protein